MPNEDPFVFPHHYDEYTHGERETFVERGITLRDYFAARVMQSAVLLTMQSISLRTPGGIARYAYTVADAMLAQRGK